MNGGNWARCSVSDLPTQTNASAGYTHISRTIDPLQGAAKMLPQPPLFRVSPAQTTRPPTGRGAQPAAAPRAATPPHAVQQTRASAAGRPSTRGEPRRRRVTRRRRCRAVPRPSSPQRAAGPGAPPSRRAPAGAIRRGPTSRGRRRVPGTLLATRVPPSNYRSVVLPRE